MTIFVASLFLPYTANFESGEAKEPKQDVNPAARLIAQAVATQQADLYPAPHAIRNVNTFPATTSSDSELHRLFVSQGIQKPPLMRLPSATRLATLARPDTHAPGWGRVGPGPRFAQPSSRAKSPPPLSVLRHQGRPEPPAEDDPLPVNQRPRTFSSENRLKYEEYSIEPSHMGNGGLVAAIDAACDDKIWVGTLGMPTNALSEKVKASIKERLELDFESLSIWVDDDDMTGLYEQYCKTILWPHLHYQSPDHPKSKAYEDHSWGFYVKVNESFANTIVKSWKKGDKIWIHDYHLMLVPGMIRKLLPDAEIGFFMHVAFPSSEIFRCLATRNSLLEGLLGSNMVGFQTDEYVHHFLQTCSRLLNVEVIEQGLIMENGRIVQVATYPLGVDPPTIVARCQYPEVKQHVESISQKYKDKKLVVARDKLDNIRGVYQKLQAYERFLQDFPEYRENVVLIQIATTTTEDAVLTSRVMDVVTRINSVYSTLEHHPLLFLNQDLEATQWTALLNISDCLMVTSLREGMNLNGHEFVLCQDGKGGKTKHSPLILSEFTGAASVLKSDAILINPWDKKGTAHAIARALKMSPEEKFQRWSNMHNTVVQCDASKWYRTYIDALSQAYQEHSVRDAISVPRLSIPQLKKTYESASKRLLIIDYEGTLAHYGSPAESVLSTPRESAEVLNDLIEDIKNTVYVMSARPMAELEALFLHVYGVGLIAENGGFLRKAGHHDTIEICPKEHVESWRDGVTNVLDYYQDRIKGSVIEELQSCIIFKYDQAEDSNIAFNQAAECANHINDLCAAQGVQAIPIEHGIFISDKDINKSTAANIIMDEMRASSKDENLLPDFLLVIGDSREDEYVFDWAHKMVEIGVKDCITVTVGHRSSAASCTIAQGVVGMFEVVIYILQAVLTGTGVLSALRKLTTGPSSSP